MAEGAGGGCRSSSDGPSPERTARTGSAACAPPLIKREAGEIGPTAAKDST